MATTTRHAIDRTIELDGNGSRQRIRLRAEREGRSPLLIVQGGPGLPLLNEVRKFQRLLDLERDFLVGYWEQRGCGDAPAHEAERVSIEQQVADFRMVLQWFFEHANQRVIVLAISLGGTVALQAAERELQHLKAIVGVSPDSHTAIGDAAVDLLTRPPRVPVPVHYVFGERDALNPPAIVNRLPKAIGAPATTVTIVPEAGHMVHFDHPHVVRSIVVNASVAVSG